ncbi:MAG: CBS domain-containing protein [Candidatus Methanofastidiosia archaeon]
MENSLSVSIKEFITPCLLTTGANKSLLEAAKLMMSLDIGSLLVEEDKKPRGIITERDILRAVASEKDLVKTKIREVMTPDLITISSEKKVKDALVLMARENIGHMLVEENGKLIGMFSFKNFLDLERMRSGFI